MAPTIIITPTKTGAEAPSSSSTPQPEGLLARQVSEPYFIVTLSITRAYTTFTTAITLGEASTLYPDPQGSPIIMTSIPASPSPTSPPSLAPAAPLPSSTTTAPANSSLVVPAPPSTDQSSTTTIAAITGSVLGALGAILLLWLCFSARRSGRLWFAPPPRRSSLSERSDSSSASYFGRPAPSPPLRPASGHGRGAAVIGAAAAGAGLAGIMAGRTRMEREELRFGRASGPRPARNARPGVRDIDFEGA